MKLFILSLYQVALLGRYKIEITAEMTAQRIQKQQAFSFLFLDFLCPPVSKEQVVEECGLGEDYLITDLNPQALGLNLAEAEIISGGNIYDDDLNFQCYELQSE